MSDPTTNGPATNAPATPTVEERFAGVVDRIKQSLLTRAQFRPTDPALQPAFDADTASLLNALQDAAAGAAVDERALVFATDRSNARNARELASETLRANTDAALLTITGNATQLFLTAASGSKS